MKPDVTELLTLRHTAKQAYWFMSQCSSTHKLLKSSSNSLNNAKLCTQMHIEQQIDKSQKKQLM